MPDDKSDFKFIEIDGWKWVKESALTTIGKNSVPTNGIHPDWKRKMLFSEHSPIRELRIHWKKENLMRWIADQIVRHTKHSEAFMKTGRTDRCNIPRSEQTMEMATDLMKTENAQSLIEMMSDRLCIGNASKETRELMESLKREITKKEPLLGLVLVPSCVRYGCCKEKSFGNGCNHFDHFIDYVNGRDCLGCLFLKEERYKLYEDFISDEI